MKLRSLLLLAAALPAVALAENGDNQTVFRVSGTTQSFAITSTSARSALLSNTASRIRAMSNVDSHIVFADASATATVSSTPLPANTPEYFKITPSDGNYVAVIRDSADGKVWLDDMRQ